MKNQADYSQYECPYSHIEKECGHELKGPEGYENTHGVWCACGFRGPVFYLDPEKLRLKKKPGVQDSQLDKSDGMTVTEAIEQLKAIQDAGHGNATLRLYSELPHNGYSELYAPAQFILHPARENPGNYDESYGTWVEVQP